MQLADSINMSMPSIITQTHKAGDGRIFQITINRPEVYNCINGDAAALLLDAWKTFRDDDSLTVALLHGAGDMSFCSGADLKSLNELVNINANKEEEKKFIESGTGPMGGTRIVQTKPVITVSQGYTYAGGLELFCHGHIRLAEEQATFSVACRRWGVPLADGGTVYLPRLLGLGTALPLIITGQKITAQRAFAIGLVWEVIQQGNGLDRAFEYARQICEQPRDALMADLASAINGYHLPIEDALRLEAGGIYEVVRSESIKKGVQKFLSGERSWFQ
ncbi:MAG TPA: enoyl-CoA hydratase-related protein [Chitinophagales bacterium]|nr:enoyl-CoA hydratase-related protein [Chitinophagales bacterium]